MEVDSMTSTFIAGIEHEVKVKVSTIKGRKSTARKV
jgi:hypothetical protein